MATALSSSTASLAWTDNSNNELGFKIERKTGSGGVYNQIGTQGANLNFFNDSELAASTQYCYRVRAYNSTGDSAYSNEACTTTLGNSPGSFTLSANAYCNTTPPVAPAIALSWSTSSGATNYDVYRNGALYAPGITGTSYDNNLNVTAGQSYSYYVVAKNSTGTTQSNTVTVSVPSNVCDALLAPTISSVSPNPVTGANNPQPFTINGSNFVSGATVTLRDLDTGEPPFTNRLISFFSNTQIVINPNFTVAPHRWSVEVINPGEISSGPFPFEVISPDLIVESVTFSPTSVMSGNSFTISFRIRNVGSGAAIATQARLRLSLDQNLTLNDLLLSPLDVDIPPLAPEAFYDFSDTVTVPGSTTQGQYYVGVFADWDNRANQSKVTNDAGLSPAWIAVTGTGISTPTITQQPPQSTIANVGDQVTLSVDAVSEGPVRYQWKHDGHEIEGEANSHLSFFASSAEQAGNYSLDLFNAAGPKSSNSTSVSINTTPMTCFRQELKLYQYFKQADGSVPRPENPAPTPNKPTIVITHGWQPHLPPVFTAPPYNPSAPPVDFDEMAKKIVKRLDSEGIEANVLAYAWSGAHTIDPVVKTSPFILGCGESAFSNALDAGRALALQLSNLLPNAGTIHMIGHSYGTVVNAVAAQQSGLKIAHFTMLDPPFFLSPRLTKKNYYDWLNEGQIALVESYIAGDTGGVGGPPVFSGPIEGAYPNGGKVIQGETHWSIDNYYANAIWDDGSPGLIGLFHSSAVFDGKYDVFLHQNSRGIFLGRLYFSLSMEISLQT